MNKDHPLVCVCIPVFNAESTIRESLESILAQTYSNLIVHVCDNASTDETLKVVESIADSRVVIHRNVENIGGEGNFNRCIQLAEGDYTAIFHADDVYEPGMVAKQVAFLEANPSAGAVFTEASLIDERSVNIGEIRLPATVASSNGLYDFETMFKAVLRYLNFFICPSVMVRTLVYQQEIKCWRGELFKSSSDLDIWLRIMQHHPVGYLQERLMRYRISGTQGSAKVRMGTERSDFFLVLDHYLEQESVRALLNADDVMNYGWLDRRDRMMRAVNLFLLGRPEEVKGLLYDACSWDALKAAFHTRRGRIVLLVNVYVKLMLLMRPNRVSKWPLAYMKQLTHK